MNFGFDEEQKSLGETVAQVLADFPALTAPDLAPTDDAAAWDALAGLGLFALGVPERFDGVGLGAVDVALAVEALGAGLAPPLVVSTLIATDLLVRHGSDGQQRALLPAIAGGAAKVALAVSEAGHGYGAADGNVRFADGRLRGDKILVAGADTATHLVVQAQGPRGPLLLLVERDASGIDVRPHHDIDPSSGLAAVALDLAIDEAAIVGAAAPRRAVERLNDVAATYHAGMLTGIAARMLDAAVGYARTREQFGQPIGAFQAIKHRCADMAVALEGARSAAYYAFWTVAEDAPDRARAASMAKAYCGEVARQVCNETIQVHGGMGFTWELGLHRFLRRSKVLEHAFGDAAWHNERVLAETLSMMGVGDPRRAAA